MPRSKFRPVEREEMLAKVARMYRRGYTQAEIGKEVGVSGPMVCKYLKELKLRYKASQDSDLEEVEAERESLIHTKESQYLEIIREAWEAWELSKRSAKRTITKQTITDGRNGITGTDEVTEIVEKRIPNNQYLNTIKECWESICKLRGINAPDKVDIRANVLNWDALVSELPQGVVPDTIEQRINKLLSEHTQDSSRGTSYTPGSKGSLNIDNTEGKDTLNKGNVGNGENSGNNGKVS